MTVDRIPALLEPIQNRLNGANVKTVHHPAFGDVLRIVWTTYYFGADLKWHNARSGDVESPETLAAEQEAADGDWEWMIPSAAPTDQARLLAAVQAVVAECDRMDEVVAIRSAIPSSKSWQANRIRAAVEAALGGEASV